MRHKLFAALIAGIVALGAVAPTDAFARDRRGHGHYDNHYRGDHYRRHRDNGSDELAAGVLGLVVGLAIGAAASDRNDPPPAYRQDGYRQDGYYQGDYRQGGYSQSQYDQGYDAYADDYGDRALEGGYAQAAPPQSYSDDRGCIRQVEQWDPVSGRYAIVNLRQPCG